jgi:hypothetical protein
MKKLKCPCCEKDLEVTHKERYQDLGEHVCSPNSIPSMKNGYQCLNKYCIANNLNCSWIEDGEIYIDPPKEISWSVAHRTIENCSVSGMYWALNSWNHYYQLGKKKTENRTIKIDLIKWKFNIIPKEKGWNYEEHERYNPSFWRYKLEIWKKTGDHTYVNVIPIPKMVIFCIKQFNRNYKSWKKSGSKYALNECLNEIQCKTSWGKKDDRTYARISSFLVNLLYRRKCNELLNSN